MDENSNSIKNEEYIKDLNSDISSNTKHNKHTKKHSISHNKTLSLCSIVLILCAIFLIIFFTTCNKKKNNITPTPPEPDTSWISYLDDNNETVEIDMPYCDQNVNALCKGGSSDYDIYTDPLDLTQTTNIVHSKLNGIHFGDDWDEMTDAPDYFCANLFNGNNNVIANLNLPKNIETVEDWFCFDMFYSYNRSNLPECLNLPEEFNLPQKIVTTGRRFCSHMFSGSSLQTLPPSFNLPQGITNTGSEFCWSMFEYSKIQTLPPSFNLPQGITTIPGKFCNYMFENCTFLQSLPSSFNLPQATSIGDEFCKYMFNGCSVLKYGDPNDSSTLLHIPDISSPDYFFCRDMFNNCLDLNSNSVPATPSPDDNISILRN